MSKKIFVALVIVITNLLNVPVFSEELKSNTERLENNNIGINENNNKKKQVYNSDDIIYPVEGGNIYFNPTTGIITGCDIEVKNVAIPEVIDNVEVIYIGDAAFQDCINLISITIPNYVTSIGDYTFDGCKKLSSIVIPGSVTHIGKGAFYSCKDLTIYCEKGSYAEQYSKDNNIKYELLGMQAESDILGYGKANDNSVVVNSEIRNISDKTIQNGLFLTIIYDNKGKIKGIGKQNVTIKVNEIKEITSKIECDFLAKDKVKIFL